MDQQVQCPVCTLFLHSGISLESHLDTHPKDQVIKALCSLSGAKSTYGSRSTTPLHSERSFRSRSRTPAPDDIRWNTPHTDINRDRYWSRTPSRPTRPPKSRNDTPSDYRIVDINFDNSSVYSVPESKGNNFSSKTSEAYLPSLSGTEMGHHYVYVQDQSDDTEMKYSKSPEYNPYNATNNVFAYNMQAPSPGVHFQTALLPTVNKRHDEFDNVTPKEKKNSDFVKIVPKPGNIALFKTNVGSLQYIPPSVKPIHVMMPNGKSFMQTQNSQNNIIMTGNLSTDTVQTKPSSNPISPAQFSQISSASFIPNTTVVTQNSQIIYREMVHNIDGKPFNMPSMPPLLNHQDVANVAQQSSVYQNLMMMEHPYGSPSCMYTPQALLSHATSGTTFNSNLTVTTSQNKFNSDKVTEHCDKDLIMEVGPMVQQPEPAVVEPSVSVIPMQECEPSRVAETGTPVNENSSEGTITKKGLKILSNIKVEVPVQHHKSLLNTIVDLTETREPEFFGTDNTRDNRVSRKSNSASKCESVTSFKYDPAHISNTFSVIKNIGNPTNHKEQKYSNTDNSRNNEMESSDSCPVPDLICNEKPSISPCSDLTESRENSTDNTFVSLRSNEVDKTQDKKCSKSISKNYKNSPLKINNLYVKKHKKILQIKNAKMQPSKCSSRENEELAVPSTSASNWPESYSMTKVQQTKSETHYDNKNPEHYSTSQLQTKSVNKEEVDNNMDADTEEQSMDIEPATLTSICYKIQQAETDVVHVKEETNNSNEKFSNEQCMNLDSSQLEPMRPVNVIAYGNISSENDGDKHLLELDTATSKSKQFVNMMNDNYFGDNFYADYFTPDRVEALDAVRELNDSKVQQKMEERCEGIYMWGEPSHKDNYIIPNFIHDGYKMAENVACSNYTLNTDGVLEEVELVEEGEACERDSKQDVLSESRSESETALDISADERMPPRGELSGQESNGDMDSATWTGQEAASSASYDLMAREAWLSDGSEADPADKRDNLDEVVSSGSKRRGSECAQCGLRFASARELRTHCLAVHPAASPPALAPSLPLVLPPAPPPAPPPPYAILISNSIKTEKDEPPAEPKAAVNAPAALTPYVDEAKPKLEAALIKAETRRRRRDYVCPTCKVDQQNELQFQAHLKIHPLECLTCGKYFFRRSNLALHIKTHLGIKNFKCEVCEKRFITKHKMIEHQTVHTGRAPVKCTHCECTFRRHSNMIQHRNRHHLHVKRKVRDWVCNVCGDVFHSVRKLAWHRETHEERPRACPYCSEKFVHTASLTRHVRRAHNAYYLPDESRRHENVSCPVCKQIYLKTNMEIHMKTHSGAKPFQCVVCNKNFTTKWNLKLHRWTHASRSAKPYKCELCKGAFIRQSDYTAHMNAHKAVRPYTCNYCGCQFIRKYNCQRHVREHEVAKRFVCQVADCGKSFHRTYYLTEHMRVHSGARPFACAVCGKTSSNKSNHNKHLKIHHTREPVATEA